LRVLEGCGLPESGPLWAAHLSRHRWPGDRIPDDLFRLDEAVVNVDNVLQVRDDSRVVLFTKSC
jgi:hypothetical protein